VKSHLQSLLSGLSGASKPSPGSEEARELQSAGSRRLLQRIRAVITRRDLVLPYSPSRSAVDPNSIAEYLDGALPSDRAAEIEELCLASDKYLAEIAGCREILDRMPTQASTPSSAAVQRMYGLYNGPVGWVSEETGPTHRWLGWRVRWIMAGLGAVLIFLVLIVLVKESGILESSSNEPVFQSGPQASNESDATSPPANKEKVGQPANPKPVPNSLGKVVAAREDLPTMLLRQQDNSWHMVRPASAVLINDHLLSLPGFQSEIQLDSGIQLRLLGNWATGRLGPQPEPEPDESAILESAVTVQRDTDFDLELTLHRGRIAIANKKPRGHARVRVQFRGEKWDLTLAEPGTEAALELRSYYPPGSPVNTESNQEEPAAELRLFAIHGQVRLQVRYDSYSLHMPPGSAAYSWNNVGAISRGPNHLERLPAWTTSLVLPDGALASLKNLQARMIEGQSVESILKEYLNKPDVNSRVLAVYSLGAIEDSSALLDVLGNERQLAPVRLAALAALRNWIGRDAKNDHRLFAAIGKKYSSTTAEVVLHLLHGFSPIQLEQPALYANLVGYLKHSDLPVRELAFRQLRTLLPEGRHIPYDPAGGRALRDRAAEEWKKLVPLVPEESVPKKN